MENITEWFTNPENQINMGIVAGMGLIGLALVLRRGAADRAVQPETPSGLEKIVDSLENFALVGGMVGVGLVMGHVFHEKSVEGMNSMNIAWGRTAPESWEMQLFHLQLDTLWAIKNVLPLATIPAIGGVIWKTWRNYIKP